MTIKNCWKLAIELVGEPLLEQDDVEDVVMEEGKDEIGAVDADGDDVEDVVMKEVRNEIGGEEVKSEIGDIDDDGGVSSTKNKEATVVDDGTEATEAVEPRAIEDTVKDDEMEEETIMPTDKPEQPVAATEKQTNIQEAVDLVDSTNKEESYDVFSDDDDDDDFVLLDDQKGRLDLTELARLLEEGKKHTSNVKPGSDVVLVLGGTGVGKSTFIQWLAGHTIIQDGYNEFDSPRYVVDGPGEQGFEIGHSMSSATLHTRSFFRECSSVHFVDSSGFGDSRGDAIDMATSICVKDIATQAGRLRFVVLISAYSFKLDRAKELRRILDLVSKFVGNNYDAFKTCFTILFTHSLGVFPGRETDSADSMVRRNREKIGVLLDNVKKSLPKSEKQVRKLTMFLVTSLKKGWPFCDIFDPVLSRREDIVNQVEQFGKANTQCNAVTNPAANIKISLTPTANAMLSTEVARHQEEISEKLQQNTMDEAVFDNVRALWTLSTHIPVSCCQRSIEVSKRHLTNAIANKEEVLRGAIERGLLSPELPIRLEAIQYCVAEAKAAADFLVLAQDAMRVLGGLPSACQDRGVAVASEDGVMYNIRALFQEQGKDVDRQLDTIASLVEVDASSNPELSNLESLHGKLQVMSCWAAVSELECRGEFEELCERVQNCLADTGENCVSKLSSDRLLNDGPAIVRLCVFFSNLKSSGLLDLVLSKGQGGKTRSRKWDAIFSDGDRLIHQLVTSVPQSLQGVIDSVFGNSMTDPEPSPDDVVFSELTVVLQNVERMGSYLLSGGVGGQLQKFDPCQKSLSLTTRTFRYHANVCGLLVDNLGKPKSEALLGRCFGCLDAFVKCMPNSVLTDGRFVAHQASLNRRLRVKLEATAREARDNISHLFHGSRLREPSFYSKPIATLRRCLWFDSIFHSDDDSRLQKSLEDIETQAIRRMQALLRALDTIVTKMCTSELSSNAIEQNRMELVDGRSRIFLSQDLLRMQDRFSADFQLKVKEYCDSLKEFQWWDSPLTDTDVSEAGKVLRVVSSLCGIDSEIDVAARPVRDHLQTALKTIGKKFSARITEEGCFDEKQTIMTILKGATENSVLCQLLPSFVSVQNAVSKQVEQYANNLNEWYRETHDVSALQDQVSYLVEASKFVDAFIGGRGDVWVQYFHTILRSQSVDGNFRRVVLENDFMAARKLLENLQARNDGERFTIHHGFLVQHIQSLVASVRSAAQENSEHGQLAQKFHTLSNAVDTLNAFLSKLPPRQPEGLQWELDSEIEMLRRFLMEVVEKKWIEVEGAMENFHYARAFGCWKDAEHIRELIEAPVSPLATQVANLLPSAIEEVQAFIEALLPSVATMSDSSSKADGEFDKFPPITTRLHGILGGLKRSCSVEDCCSEVLECYTRCTSLLREALQRTVNQLMDDRKDHLFSRPTTIMSFLRGEIVKGLKDHIDVWFNPDGFLRETEAAKLEFERSLRLQYGKNEVDKLANRLAKTSSFLLFWRIPEYSYSKKLANDLMTRSQDKIRSMLSTNEFGRLREQFELLQYMRCKFRDHLKIGKAMVLDLLIKQLHDLQTRMEGCLVEGRIDKFQGLFTAVQSIVAGLPPRTPDVEIAEADNGVLVHYDRTCRMFQERVISHIANNIDDLLSDFESMIESHAYVAATHCAEHLQAWGYFLTTQFESYRNSTGDDEDVIAEIIDRHFASRAVREVGRHLASLGLSRGAVVGDVSSAFRRASLRCHPDKVPGSSRRFQEISEARDYLLHGDNLELYRQHDFHFLVLAARSVRENLESSVITLLEDKDFKGVEQILHNLDGIPSFSALLIDADTKASLDPSELHAIAFKHLKRAIDELVFDIKDAWANKRFHDLHHSFRNLELLESRFKKWREVVTEPISSSLLDRLRRELEKLGDNVESVVGLDEAKALGLFPKLGRHLIEIGYVMDGFPSLKSEASTFIDSFLRICHNEPWGATFTFKLGLWLDDESTHSNSEDLRIGKLIVSSFPQFADVRTLIFNKEVAGAPVKETAEGTTTYRSENGQKQPLNIVEGCLESEFERYNKLFRQNVFGFIREGPDGLVRKVHGQLQELGECKSDQWDLLDKRHLVEVLAGVLATQTIIKSGDTFRRFNPVEDDVGSTTDIVRIATAQVTNDPMSLLFTPHVVQVLAILRLLGVDCPSSSLASHVMQVRTGEGKSIILGTLSVILALLGFSVRCVCYSEHLSARDHEMFQELFAAFNVSHRIEYSTLGDMMEKNIARMGDVRKLTKNVFTKSRTPSSSTCMAGCQGPLKWNGEEILLVDEVDVFFSADFYGRTYNPCIGLVDPVISAMYRKVWDCRHGARMADVKLWPEYSALIKLYPGCEPLIDSKVHEMLSDVHHLGTYEVDRVNCRIGYREHDSISWNWLIGSRTTFAFLHEWEKGTFGERSIDEMLKLQIFCGRLSYTNLSATRILGVSGSLKALCPMEKAIMGDFGIETFSEIPSLYPESIFDFDKAGRGILIESEMNRYFQTIMKEIEDATMKGRSAIVFFETDERLEAFRRSNFWKGVRNGNVLVSSSSKKDRDYAIVKAATPKQVTISTAIFGRGTDFFCKDTQLEDAGGMKVIQAFLSVEKSEEVQIQGRTARQGKKGSYGMVLLESDLRKFGIEAGEWSTRGRSELYDWLDEKRQAFHEENLSKLKQKVQDVAELDRETRDYVEALKRNDHEKIKSYLLKFN